jgi:hypothetical protein
VEAEKGGHLRVADEHDVAAITTVAAIRSGERLEFLALHRDAAIASIAGEEMKRYLVNEGSHNASLLPTSRLISDSRPGDGATGQLNRSSEPKLAGTFGT